jgi:hypothetical protein
MNPLVVRAVIVAKARIVLIACCAAVIGLLTMSTSLHALDAAKTKASAKDSTASIVTGRETIVDGWELDQENRGLGAQNWLITDRAARLTSPRTGLVVIYRLADDSLLQYNTNNKFFFSTKSPNASKFNAQNMAKLYGFDLRRFNWVKGRTARALNVHITEYCPQKRTDLKLSKSEEDDAQVILNTCDGYWRCDDIKAPRRIIEIVSGWNGFPMGEGVLFSLQARIDNLPVKLIETTVCKRTTIPSSEFSLPPGYTRAKSADEMMLKGSQQDMLEDLLQDRSAKR